MDKKTNNKNLSILFKVLLEEYFFIKMRVVCFCLPDYFLLEILPLPSLKSHLV